MKKIIALSVFSAFVIGAASNASAWWSNNSDWECRGPYGQIPNCNPYDEWDPRYWMEEMEDMFDDEDDYYRGGGYPYGGGYGGYPYGGGYQQPYYQQPYQQQPYQQQPYQQPYYQQPYGGYQQPNYGGGYYNPYAAPAAPAPAPAAPAAPAQ